MNDLDRDDRALRAAAFLLEALDLGIANDAGELADELTVLERGPTLATFIVELESSVGPAAFLLYVYSFAAIDGDGRSGRDRFNADLKVLETAATLETPGPRPVAHAEGDGEGYILATTPATLRALRGEPDPATSAALEADIGDLLPVGEVAEIRSNTPPELLRLLHTANEEARRWLEAVQADNRRHPAPSQSGSATAFDLTDAERELALFLLDSRSIQSLLEALNILLNTTERGAAGMLGDQAPE